METLPAIILRVRCSGARSCMNDGDFDDDHASCSASPRSFEGEAAERTCAAAVTALARSGASDAAIQFLGFATTRAGPRPAWRPLGATSPPTACDVRPGATATHEVWCRAGNDIRRLRMSTVDFLRIIPILYVASFRFPDADAFWCGKTADEVARNYALATRCVLGDQQHISSGWKKRQ
jgi:hypothetical protein